MIHVDFEDGDGRSWGEVDGKVEGLRAAGEKETEWGIKTKAYAVTQYIKTRQVLAAKLHQSNA